MKLLSQLSKFDFALAVVLLLLFAFFSWELCYAWLALPCSELYTGGCYPWGAEGPAADYWFFRTKERYLIHDLILCFTLAGGIISLLLFPKGKSKTWLVSLAMASVGFILWLLNRVHTN